MVHSNGPSGGPHYEAHTGMHQKKVCTRRSVSIYILFLVRNVFLKDRDEYEDFVQNISE